MEHLDAETPGKLFHPDTVTRQFAPGLGYQARAHNSGGSVLVTDLASSLAALEVIIDQGEGSENTPRPKDSPDHYTIFKELKDGDQTWETLPVATNPDADRDYANDPIIWQVG